jgi:hypothetical protein
LLFVLELDARVSQSEGVKLCTLHSLSDLFGNRSFPEQLNLPNMSKVARRLKKGEDFRTPATQRDFILPREIGLFFTKWGRSEDVRSLKKHQLAG